MLFSQLYPDVPLATTMKPNEKTTTGDRKRSVDRKRDLSVDSVTEKGIY